MFYLLENNKIVDSNTGKLLNLHYEVKERYLERYLMRYDDSHFFRTENLGIIKKQSENVFDLIENGDLLKIKQPKEASLKYDFGECNALEKHNYASYIKDYFPNKILAIYKPNSNGDYIKVWEKEKND